MEQTIIVIPKPVSVRYTDGFFKCRGMPGITGDAVFQQEIVTASGQQWGDFGARAEAGILCKKEAVFTDPDKASEGYKLHIGQDGITISAATGAGCYHGLQTLRQIFLSENQGGVVTIPCAEIEDYPRFPFRGYMLDSARHFFPVPVIKKLMDAISLHHINHFHWHLTDWQGWRFPVRKYPLLAEIGQKINRYETNSEGLYTAEDIKDLVSYAAARHIEIIPEVEFPGHAGAALRAYPELLCEDGAETGVFCAGNDKLFDFAAGVFDANGNG
ncbi:hypothetical protein FACS1894142_6740 [Spirochaetia bacterium]|nr:hypothetical protein FACS1894142_6740 [Spirochaetia bacterium]